MRNAAASFAFIAAVYLSSTLPSLRSVRSILSSSTPLSAIKPGVASASSIASSSLPKCHL